MLHVEAGLRSFNRAMPEETNRVLTDHISDVLFAPTETAVSNLRREGIREEQIHKVGDVMYDAALFYASHANLKSVILAKMGLVPGTYALATIHRAENTNDLQRLRVICGTLSRLAAQMPVVFPVHPRTQKILGQAGFTSQLGSVRIADPVGYLDMVMLEKNARVILTDSGGVQKEAFFYQVPCVTFRDETEWLELVELGWNRLAPPVSVSSQFQQIETALRGTPGNGHRPYGNGDAARGVAELTEAIYLQGFSGGQHGSGTRLCQSLRPVRWCRPWSIFASGFQLLHKGNMIPAVLRQRSDRDDCIPVLDLKARELLRAEARCATTASDLQIAQIM
jgi:UDP-GlcNAc3NAcA epimerase